MKFKIGDIVEHKLFGDIMKVTDILPATQEEVSRDTYFSRDAHYQCRILGSPEMLPEGYELKDTLVSRMSMEENYELVSDDTRKLLGILSDF